MHTKLLYKHLITLLIISICCVQDTIAQITANFSATPILGCSPVVSAFTDLSTGNPIQWHWDLGNGTQSTLQNPLNSYFTPGNYTIKLVVTNAAGLKDSITKTQYITVNANPTVNFIGIPTDGCAPLNVNFNNLSIAGSGSITNYQWDFGDGSLSTLANPTNTYTNSGNYNVTLRVTNSSGCITTITKPQYIKVSDPVISNFTYNILSSCILPSNVQFINSSTGSGVLSYFWNFGDGGTSTLANPTHAFNTVGNYVVSLTVTNNVGCTNTFTIPGGINIGTSTANFTFPNPICQNTNVQFTNTTNPIPLNAIWNFGDGSTSTLINPTHIFSTAGTFTVKLKVDFGACVDSITKNIIVHPSTTASFTATPNSGCTIPLQVSFTNNSLNANTYLWNFGDGNTSTLANPQNTYTAFGTYPVTLITTTNFGCTDTFSLPSNIIIAAPTVSINNLVHNDCAPLTHTFTSTVVGGDAVVNYLWNFGDGTTSNQATPTHTFPIGSYNISLTITTASGCTATILVNDGIIASSKPIANFGATPRDACAFLQINFSDSSTTNTTNWYWNFGDGSTSTQQNPMHLYEDTGYFNVTLIATNNGCSDTIVFPNYIHISPPIAVYNELKNCSQKYARQFVDASIGADEWLWNFGDGTTSTLQNPPLHIFSSVGNYAVSLTVVNHLTGCTYTITKNINIIDEKANFTTSDSTICKNTSVTFDAINNVANNVAQYFWNFGDGGTSNIKTPTHIYTQAGAYTVTLMVTDIYGCTDTLTKPLQIVVSGPTAILFPLVQVNCLNQLTSFPNNSISDGVFPITNWIFNFGDGNITNFSSPPFTHLYTTSGIYFVTLKVIDSNGCVDSSLNTAMVTISHPVASFTSSSTISCPGKDVAFNNTSSGNIATNQWIFGDGTTSLLQNPTHQFSDDGNYVVKLIIIDQNGCLDTTQQNITISSPVASFSVNDSFTTCPPLVVNFTNMSTNANSIVWNFGDGTSSQSNNPSHFYTTPGIFHATLIITSIGGCIDSIFKTITIKGPTGTFSYAPLSGCKPLTVAFTANANNNLSFIWDFNNGSVLYNSNSNFTYTYTNVGQYIPKMILVDAAGCNVAINGIDTIKVKGAIAKFGFSDSVFCNSGMTNFMDSSNATDVISTYAWNFGDGGISSNQNPNHFYSVTGTYFPKLTITSAIGCVDSFKSIKPVKIVANPQALISNANNGCVALSSNFEASLAVVDTSLINWQWQFGNGNSSTLKSPPTQVYTIAGIYPISLIATNSTGCADTVFTTIEAYPTPIIDAGIDTFICKGNSITLQATGGATYNWSPATMLNCNTCATTIATPQSSTTFLVNAASNHGCTNKDSIHVLVKNPFVMFSSRGDTICNGASKALFASGALTYQWSPSTGLSNTTNANVIAKPTTSTTYMVIGTDDKKCFSDTNYIPIKVYPIPTVFAGNDTTINVGQTIKLTPQVSADVTQITWQPLTNLVSTSYPSIFVKPTTNTTYQVNVKNPGGCTSSDFVTINLICNGANVFIPNTFSPNDDGVNDLFYPRGSGLFIIKQFKIFDRWGQLVFEKGGFKPNDISGAWDGSFKGIKLNPDVYIYIAEIECENNNILTLKGNVALIK